MTSTMETPPAAAASSNGHGAEAPVDSLFLPPQAAQDAYPLPPAQARFDEKVRYYRSQHRSKGIRATHLLGIPTVAFSVPLVLARPKLGIPLFAAGWALQVAGHRVFEKNSPALRNGPVSYQLVGLGYWTQEVVDLIAAWNERRARTGEAAPDAVKPGPAANWTA